MLYAFMTIALLYVSQNLDPLLLYNLLCTRDIKNYASEGYTTLFCFLFAPTAAYLELISDVSGVLH